MKRTPLTAMLTLAALLAAGLALSACGGKSGSSTSTAAPAESMTTTSTTTKHGHTSKPTY